ncbi:MAG: sugar phosphate isomerase/epimerase, partial [Verrucomicrobiota bacterium]
MHESVFLSRRNFLIRSVAAGVGFSAGFPSRAEVLSKPTAHKTRLGLDNFSVRAMKWNASQLIDYAASLKTDSLFITDLDAFENFEETYLRGLRQKAAEQRLQLQVGTWSICPTSKAFRPNHGSAEEHLALGIRVAKALGSPVIRVVLGTGEDRKTEGGIEARIADTVKVCRACRTRAVDAGVKIAVENHAGDLQSWELVNLIEAAGRDFVGANIDSGNAVWTMEDPVENLKTLAPYVLTSSLRDSAIWESENGATVQWTAMGEGNTDLKTYFQLFIDLCPGVPVHIETISGFNREIPYFKDDFWKVWPKAKAEGFARFLALAKKGKPREQHHSVSNEAEQEYQKDQIERSLKYCKEV